MNKEEKREKDCMEGSARGKEEFMKGWKGVMKENAIGKNLMKRKGRKRKGMEANWNNVGRFEWNDTKKIAIKKKKEHGRKRRGRTRNGKWVCSH